MLGVLGVVTGCAASAQETRVEAFGYADRGELDRAAEAVARCRQRGDDEDRYVCSATLGSIRARQAMWASAVDAYEQAFEIRDRISIDRRYGAAPPGDLYLWGYALMRTKQLAKARAVLERARAVAMNEEDGRLYVAAIDLALAHMAAQEGDATGAGRLRANAAANSCATDEVKYFGAERALHRRYFPEDVWLELGATCQQPQASALLRSHAPSISVAATQVP